MGSPNMRAIHQLGADEGDIVSSYTRKATFGKNEHLMRPIIGSRGNELHMIAPFKIMGQNDTNFSMAVHNRDGRVVYKVVREDTS